MSTANAANVSTTASTAVADQKWIQTQSLELLLGAEPFFLLSALVLLAWIFYKGFLRGVSEERHQNLRRQFGNLMRHYVTLSLLFSLYILVNSPFTHSFQIYKLMPYFAILTFFWGGLVFVKASRMIILQYMFLGSMRAGVPLLIVNIFSLGLSLVMVLWGASQIFNLQLGPLIATSAAFSIILGLALQDTLGNLFAGIALQLDHNFEIGDWLEVFHSGQKTVGQVKEISWRTTTLIGWTDEVIVLPNRVMAGAQIANFQAGDLPIIRSQVFRLPYGTDAEKAKKILVNCLDQINEVRKYPEALCLVTETTESWLSFKLIYYIDNYGSQFVVGDKVVLHAWKSLEKAGFETARTTLRLMNSETNS